MIIQLAREERWRDGKFQSAITVIDKLVFCCTEMNQTYGSTFGPNYHKYYQKVYLGKKADPGCCDGKIAINYCPWCGEKIFVKKVVRG